MTYIRPSTLDLEQGPVAIRRLRSLTGQHLDRVTQALTVTGEAWTIDPHDGCDGYLTIMVTRESDGANFVFSGRVDRVELDEVRSEVMHNIACFDTIDAAITELVARCD